jgi:hypothetical protein
MKTEVTSRELANLLGLASSEIADLSKRKILSSGSKKGTYRLQVSVRNYVVFGSGRPSKRASIPASSGKRQPRSYSTPRSQRRVPSASPTRNAISYHEACRSSSREFFTIVTRNLRLGGAL